MQAPTPPPSIKRKRSSQDPGVDSSPTRVKGRKLAGIPLLETLGPGSPRTTMACHMQKLDLQETSQPPEPPEPPELFFGAAVAASRTFEPDVRVPSGEPYPPRSGSASPSNPCTQPSTIIPSLEIPETSNFRSTQAPSPRSSRPNSKAESPDPALWWCDAEITGHGLDPRDPTDDGEGINGVGFVPTPAIAYARAEKRRRQVREWKERETREARAKRGERRRQRDLEDMINSDDREGVEGNARRVHFVEV